ncbi:MAG: hypothetical protein ACE5IK_14270 [Acidobacteriota bacterium]
MAIAAVACGSAEEAPPPVLPVTGPLALLDALEAARWEPALTNLNHPSIERIEADLGGGAFPALLSHPASALHWQLALQVPLHLTTAVGLLPAAWQQGGDGAVFRVVVRDRTRRTLFTSRLDPRHVPAERGWVPVDVDLSPWTGRTVTLTLATDPGPDEDPAYDWAVWRNPMLSPAPAP